MKTLFLIAFLSISLIGFAQNNNTIRGVVFDKASNEKISFATVAIKGTDKGIITDTLGIFKLDNIPVGRYDIEVSFMGYNPSVIREVLISSGKELFLEIPLTEQAMQLDEVVIRPKINKEEPINKIASVSSRMLSVEESSRYAGGFDDPARMVSSFAGVAGNVSSNAIAIRGNSPQFLQWRLEGVEIPNPTHFSDITGIGGGILTALSNQVMGNSDFLTGAFPSEYSNALSGVFDMQMRNGNRWKHEHSVQVGTLDIDLSSEGPFKKGGNSSYLVNYRYATMALVNDIAPDLLGNAGGMRYQDLSFKLNFPTKRAGTFSVWGIGIADKFAKKPKEDTNDWETDMDPIKSSYKQQMYSAGLGHKVFFNNSTYLKTSLATTYNHNDSKVDWQHINTDLDRMCDMRGSNQTIVFNSYLNKKFGARHTNRTGITATGLLYDLDYQISPSYPHANDPMVQFAKSDGNTMMLSAFTNSSFMLRDNLSANIGVTAQHFALNKSWSIEPRVGMKWQFIPQHSFGLGYGLHSRHEKLDYYFVEKNEELVNKDLKLAKAHHIVFSYDWSISPNLHLKVEPYYQYLFDVPVSPDGTFSIINQTDWFIDQQLISKGKGKNYGVDITLERYMADGYYYMFTGSVFESKYTANDNIWRNTRLNRNYVFNLLGGKEWIIRNKNILSANIRLTYQGGNRYSPIDESKSLLDQKAVHDESRAYEYQLNPAFMSSFTISYKINKQKTSHEFALKLINATGYKEYERHVFNYKTSSVESLENSIVMPNISYKIQF